MGRRNSGLFRKRQGPFCGEERAWEQVSLPVTTLVDNSSCLDGTQHHALRLVVSHASTLTSAAHHAGDRPDEEEYDVVTMDSKELACSLPSFMVPFV